MELLTRDDGVGFSLKNNVIVYRLCFRALRALKDKRQFFVISIQKQDIFADILQNVYPVILIIILSLFFVNCLCLPALKDFRSGGLGVRNLPPAPEISMTYSIFSHFILIKWLLFGAFLVHQNQHKVPAYCQECYQYLSCVRLSDFLQLRGNQCSLQAVLVL